MSQEVGSTSNSAVASNIATPNLIAILAAVVALGPISVDLYLPAMPSMVRIFDTDIEQVQLTLSAYLFGFAIFHLICGPLSDRFGRKPILIAGLSLYVVMSVFCALAETVEELILFRFIQAMGACCAPTLGRAVVRDVFPPKDAVKALAYVASLMALAPVVAPSLGGVLVIFGDWSLTFWALAIYGVLAILLVIFFIPESLPVKQSLHPARILRNYGTLLRSRAYMGNVLTSASLYSSIFAFLSVASFVLIDFMGVKTEHFGFYFVVIVVGYIAGNMLTARVAYRWSTRKVFGVAISLSCLSSTVMVLFCLLQWYQPMLIVVPMLVVTMAVGIILPKASAEALKPFPEMAATASAMMGFLQMGAASLTGWVVALFLEGPPLPLALGIFGTGCSALLCYLLILPRDSSHDGRNSESLNEG
ncbi:hypothetical protein A9Q99_17645 [Gammaproteobacteria bacterium 45_16_T64]|nr:hypothetical protein A9Q99_17645 [Gammaproteobacteria bacterium 45_16_T64]